LGDDGDELHYSAATPHASVGPARLPLYRLCPLLRGGAWGHPGDAGIGPRV